VRRLPAHDIVDYGESDMTEECYDRDTAPDSGVKYRPEASDG
jgi:hypothetical protein